MSMLTAIILGQAKLTKLLAFFADIESFEFYNYINSNKSRKQATSGMILYFIERRKKRP